jgi:hypothetical protein
MNDRIGICSVCLEDPIQLLKWANDECTHSFCADCTRQMLEQNLPLCPLCRRPHVRPRARRHANYVLVDIITILLLTFDIITMTISKVWRFTQTNSPLQFLWWVISVWVALCTSATYSAVLCNANILPNVLHFYDANETLVFSWNITMIKQAIVYCREHTLVLDTVCQIITK